VEEQPLYEPCGQGEHLYLFVEKTEMTTHELVRRVAKKLRVSKRDVGFAGLKDKYAITRQHLSVYLPGGSAEEDAKGVAEINRYQRIQVLWAARHTNKLRKGHHGGNRFVLRIRGVEPTAVLRAKPILDRVVERGVPNYIGPQRFGFRNNSQDIGRLLLLGRYQQMLDEMLGRAGEDEYEGLSRGRRLYLAGEYAAALEVWPKSLRYDRQALDALYKGFDAAKVVRAIDREQRDFLACAFQSAVFNDVLRRRVEDGTFDRVLVRDVLHHLSYDDRVNVIDESLRLLSDGGVLTIIEGNANNWINRVFATIFKHERCMFETRSHLLSEFVSQIAEEHQFRIEMTEPSPLFRLAVHYSFGFPRLASTGIFRAALAGWSSLSRFVSPRDWWAYSVVEVVKTPMERAAAVRAAA